MWPITVTLYYKTWPNVDIVPVSRVVNDDDTVAYYKVPDMNNETWIPSQPVRHGKEMSDRNSSFGKEFKRIIKMIKWWNHQHGSYLQSYHIEILALHTLTASFRNYPWNVFQFFDKSIELAQEPLWHHAGRADSYLDWKKRQEVVKRLETARDKARNAWHKTYGSNSDHREAIGIWRQVFGGEFPAYG